MRTRKGIAVSEAKRRLRGRQPKLTTRQEAHLVELHRAGGYVSRSARIAAVPAPTVGTGRRGSRTPAGPASSSAVQESTPGMSQPGVEKVTVRGVVVRCHGFGSRCCGCEHLRGVVVHPVTVLVHAGSPPPGEVPPEVDTSSRPAAAAEHATVPADRSADVVVPETPARGRPGCSCP